MDELTPILLLIISGLLIRFSLIISGQHWAKSHAQTVTFLILPIITYIITKTISGNIALSLGMIGALSIVRFRHPVKSALELVIYFDLITLGIATSVRTKWAIQLVICTILIIILIKLVHGFLKKYNKSFYSISFNEGAQMNIVEIETKSIVEDLEKNINLLNFIEDKNNKKIIYRLGFENRETLIKFKESLNHNKDIEKINVSFN